MPEINKHLFDILESIQEIKRFISDSDFDKFLSSPLLKAAVERKFQIIGEALNRISKEDSDILENIRDYKRIISFRNIIVHGYDDIDYEILWDVATNKITQLEADVKTLLDNN